MRRWILKLHKIALKEKSKVIFREPFSIPRKIHLMSIDVCRKMGKLKELLHLSLTIHDSLGLFRISMVSVAVAEIHFYSSQTWRQLASPEQMKPSFLECYCFSQDLPKSLACAVLDMLWEYQRSLYLSRCLGFSMHNKRHFVHECTKHVSIMKLERWLTCSGIYSILPINGTFKFFF